VFDQSKGTLVVVYEKRGDFVIITWNQQNNGERYTTDLIS